MAVAKYAKICYFAVVFLVGCSLIEDFNYIDLAFLCFLIFTFIRYIYVSYKH